MYKHKAGMGYKTISKRLGEEEMNYDANYSNMKDTQDKHHSHFVWKSPCSRCFHRMGGATRGHN